MFRKSAALFTLTILALVTRPSLATSHRYDRLTKATPLREWSAILPDDFVGALLDGITTDEDLVSMEARGLKRASLKTTPWSDSYWPTMYGGVAWRYNDPYFPKSREFTVNHRYFQSNPPTYLSLDTLSPAEKYDRLVGDTSYSLTQANWKSGLSRMEQFGAVLSWEGFCHGWAVAAFSQPEPKRAVTVTSARGELITFYPSDIKALTTLIYATGQMPIEFVGTKCFDEKPSEDEIGRNVNDECLTTNPGTWHVGVVNRLGVGQQSFVIDITYDQAIWNQPVVAYSYSYFNPKTLEVSTELADAAVPIGQFPRDKFKKHRAPGTAFVVGINMDLTYARENTPVASERPQPPELLTIRYVYDLELDANRKILGGEWYSKIHPDFVWAPGREAHPRSKGESDLKIDQTWNANGPLPRALLDAARLSSPRNQPVFGIVKGLLDQSTRAEYVPQ